MRQETKGETMTQTSTYQVTVRWNDFGLSVTAFANNHDELREIARSAKGGSIEIMAGGLDSSVTVTPSNLLLTLDDFDNEHRQFDSLFFESSPR